MHALFISFISLMILFGSVKDCVGETLLDVSARGENTGGARHARQKRAVAVMDPIDIPERVAGVLRHNQHREAMNSSNIQYMTWNSELTRMAQAHAEKCVFEHSDKKTEGYDLGKYGMAGENLHYSTKKTSLSDAVDAWYVEIDYYTYDTRSCLDGEMCGHYTQVVWWNSMMVGCGRAFCPTFAKSSTKTIENVYYTNCNYVGPGNYAGAPPFIQGEACSECKTPRTGCKMGLCYDPEFGEGPDVNKTVNTSGGNETTTGSGVAGPDDGEGSDVNKSTTTVAHGGDTSATGSGVSGSDDGEGSDVNTPATTLAPGGDTSVTGSGVSGSDDGEGSDVNESATTLVPGDDTTATGSGVSGSDDGEGSDVNKSATTLAPGGDTSVTGSGVSGSDDGEGSGVNTPATTLVPGGDTSATGSGVSGSDDGEGPGVNTPGAISPTSLQGELVTPGSGLLPGGGNTAANVVRNSNTVLILSMFCVGFIGFK